MMQEHGTSKICNTTVCRDFNNRGCQRGEQCVFAHITEQQGPFAGRRHEPPGMSREARFESRDNKSVFLGGIPEDMSESTLKAYFSQFGQCKVSVKIDTQSGKSRGFGFCEFETEQAIDTCCSQGDHYIMEKFVDVKRYTSRRDRGLPAEEKGKGKGQNFAPVPEGVCKFFARGKCDFGDRCRLKHIKLGPAMAPQMQMPQIGAAMPPMQMPMQQMPMQQMQMQMPGQMPMMQMQAPMQAPGQPPVPGAEGAPAPQMVQYVQMPQMQQVQYVPLQPGQQVQYVQAPAGQPMYGAAPAPQMARPGPY